LSTNPKKLILEENVGGFDLLFRTTFGTLATIALAMNLVKTSPWKWIFALIAFTGLFSSIVSHCTPYSIFGISTAKKKIRTHLYLVKVQNIKKYYILC
jgi:hypothetical protein